MSTSLKHWLLSVGLACALSSAVAQRAPGAPPAATEAASAAVAAGGAATPCPPGWRLVERSPKPDGAFQCSAMPGKAAPAQPLRCAKGLSYYANTQKGRLGCRH